MGWRIIEEGEVPSLSLGRIKSAFRIEHDLDDELLRHLIQVARQYIENYTYQLLGDFRVEVTLDRWEKSKHPWSGLTGNPNVPLVWIPLPVGPFRTLESVSIRQTNGEWIDIPAHQFVIQGHRLGVRADWPAVPFKMHSIVLVGRCGLTPIPAFLEGVWMNVVRSLYESDQPDMKVVQEALKPLSVLKFKAVS